MVDVGEKEITQREAQACGWIQLSEEAYAAVLGRKVKKGDVMTVAQVAGIMGAKRTAELIPMCHTIVLTHVSLTFETEDETRRIRALCRVRCEGKTGVEMEALTGVSTALLTIYDMCKAIDKRMVMGEICLLAKSGGKSGDFIC